MSSIGWIDFSSTDRKRVHEVLALMKEPGTLDELGFGQLRDAYADTLFPGFTTIQTRARYFLAVPKIMLDWADLPDAKRRRRPLDEYLKIAENDFARTLKTNYHAAELEPDGVIGHTVVEQGGVARRPSSTYWNGLRVFEIIRTQSSLAEFCRYWRRDGDAQEAVSSDEGSDDTERRFESVVRRPPGSHGDWPDGLTLKLNVDEARFLRERFTTSRDLDDTVCAQLLSNNLAASALSDDHASFAAFSAWAAGHLSLSQKCRSNIAAAQHFSLAVEGAHIVFNRLIAEGIDDDRLHARCGELYADWRVTVELAGVFHPGADFEWLSVAEAGSTRVKRRTIEFLERWNVLNQARAPNQSDIDALVRTQAINNKPARSLLIKLPRERADWYGMGALDYRWQTVRRMLNDIVEVLPC